MPSSVLGPSGAKLAAPRRPRSAIVPRYLARNLLAFSAILPAALGALSAHAQYYEGARLLGLAEAQRALTIGNDSIYVNPAGLALGSMYVVELGYLDDARGSDRRFNASIIDSQAGPIAGGIAYTYTKRRPDDVAQGEERLVGHRMEIALATRVAEGAAIGATVRYLTFDRKEGEVDVEGGFDAITVDAGLQWHIADSISIGAAGYNLTNSSRRELPIGWGAGIGYQLETFTIEGDVRYNAQIGKAAYSLGAGLVIANMLPIRGGVTYDLASETVSVSAGLGFFIDRAAIDIGYRQRVTGDRSAEDDDNRILGVAIRGTFM